MASEFQNGKDGLPFIRKDPDANLDYQVDWSDWLGADTLAASVWTITPAGAVTSGPASFSAQDGTTRLWVSGGTPGQTVKVTNRITTALGRVDERSFNLRIADR